MTDKFCSWLFTPTDPQNPHYPFMGPRPQKYPITYGAKVAQFPFVYYYRYSTIVRPLIWSLFPTFFILHKIEKASYSPGNVEEWKRIRKEWYEPKRIPEYDLF